MSADELIKMLNEDYELVRYRTKENKKDNLANLERVVIAHKLEGDDLKGNDCRKPFTQIEVKCIKEIK